MARAEEMLQAYDDVISDGARRGMLHNNAEDERLDGRIVTVRGRELVNFGSCSYLGLETHPALKAGVVDAVERFGTQFSSSRGYLSSPGYATAERALTALFGRPTLITPSTTMGHLATIPTVVESGDAFLMDHQVHTSVQTASKLAQVQGTRVELIPHNDLRTLERRIGEYARGHRRVWYAVDGLYSMYADFAPFEQLNELMERHPTLWLYVDDAHSFSWTGRHGRGYALERLSDTALTRSVVAGSLNKSFAAAGGAITFPDDETRRRVFSVGGPLIFSGPVQPPMLGAVLASARLHLTEEVAARQQRLRHLIGLFNRLATERGLPLVSPSEAPIRCVGAGTPQIAYNLCGRLQRAGYFVDTATFPAVAAKRSGARLTLTAHHTDADVVGVVDALAEALPAALADEGSSMRELERVFRRQLAAGHVPARMPAQPGPAERTSRPLPTGPVERAGQSHTGPGDRTSRPHTGPADRAGRPHTGPGDRTSRPHASPGDRTSRPLPAGPAASPTGRGAHSTHSTHSPQHGAHRGTEQGPRMPRLTDGRGSDVVRGGARADLWLERHSTIHTVDRAEWDAMLGGRGAFDVNGLRALEAVFAGDSDRPEHRWAFHYWIARDRAQDGRPVAATFFTTALWKDDMLASAAVSTEIERERLVDPYHLTSTMVGMGTLLTEGDHLYLDRDADWRGGLRLILAAARTEEDHRGAAAVALRDLPDGDTELHQFLLGEGFVRVPVLDTWVREVDFADDERFLAGLSKKARYHQRTRVLGRENEYLARVYAGGGPEAATLDDSRREQLYQLYRNVHANNLELNVFPLPPGIIDAILDNPGWELVTLELAEAPGTPVAFAAQHIGADHVQPLFVGLDYRYVASHDSYQQTLWQAIRSARRHGVSRVLYGMSAGLHKARFGAVPEKRWVYVQSTDDFHTAVVTAVAERLAVS